MGTCSTRARFFYRVTIQVVYNLTLTSKQKFHFSMRAPIYYVLKQNFDVNRRFVTT